MLHLLQVQSSSSSRGVAPQFWHCLHPIVSRSPHFRHSQVPSLRPGGARRRGLRERGRTGGRSEGGPSAVGRGPRPFSRAWRASSPSEARLRGLASCGRRGGTLGLSARRGVPLGVPSEALLRGAALELPLRLRSRLLAAGSGESAMAGFAPRRGADLRALLGDWGRLLGEWWAPPERPEGEPRGRGLPMLLAADAFRAGAATCPSRPLLLG